MQLSFSLALIAGLVSFLSPCVLPLVPAYIGYLGGRVTNTVAAQTSGGAALPVKPMLGSRFSTMLHGLAFVAGFTFVFVALGLLGTAFVSVIGRQSINTVTNIIGRGGGILIIFFGLHFMGILPSVINILIGRRSLLNSPVVSVVFAVVVMTLVFWIFQDWLYSAPIIALIALALVLGGAFTRSGDYWTKALLWLQRVLYADTRRQMIAQGHQSYAGSAIMGVIFSAGWTPCIGPIYGSILTMAAMGGDVATAGTLLLAYSLGLGIPFVVAAFLLDQTQVILKHLQRHLHKIELATGAFLVVIGVLVASGRLQYLSQNFALQFADFSYNLEDCTIKLTQGQIALGSFNDCMNPPPIVLAPAANTFASATPEAQTVRRLEIGTVAPEFATTTDQGAIFNLADQRGKVVILNFWATDCDACRLEMPEFEQAYNAKAAQGLIVLGINNAEAVDVVAAFRDELKLSFPLLLDPDTHIQNLYAVSTYPSTYVLNRDGLIVNQHAGALSAEQIADLVAQVLA